MQPAVKQKWKPLAKRWDTCAAPVNLCGCSQQRPMKQKGAQDHVSGACLTRNSKTRLRRECVIGFWLICAIGKRDVANDRNSYLFPSRLCFLASRLLFLFAGGAGARTSVELSDAVAKNCHHSAWVEKSSGHLCIKCLRMLMITLRLCEIRAASIGPERARSGRIWKAPRRSRTICPAQAIRLNPHRCSPIRPDPS